MSRLNNKGQTLVLFVLLLPIMLCVMVLVFDIGKFLCEKQNLNNLNSMVISYGLKHYGDDNLENDLTKLILLNRDDLNSVEVNINDNEIYVDLLYMDSSILGTIFNISIFEVRSSYVGDVKNDKIKRIK